MQSLRADNAGNGRLRFLFDGAVVSFGLAANSTFEDVARTLGELEPQGYGNPVAIDVTMAAPSRSFGTLHSIHPT
jgi:hypothetical protein